MRAQLLHGGAGRPIQQLIPRGLSRAEAAHYIGVSPAYLDKLTLEGTMPMRELDSAFDAIGNHPALSRSDSAAPSTAYDGA